jgi:hypothetical protein
LGRGCQSFLSEVNVSVRLWDEMIRIPPENVRVLSSDELTNFGLKGKTLCPRRSLIATMHVITDCRSQNICRGNHSHSEPATLFSRGENLIGGASATSPSRERVVFEIRAYGLSAILHILPATIRSLCAYP